MWRKIKKEDNKKKLVIPLIIVSILCVCTIVSTITLSVLYYNNFVEYQTLTEEYQGLSKGYENMEKSRDEWKAKYYEQIPKKEIDQERFEYLDELAHSDYPIE